MADLFVSYASEDRETAQRIARGLEAEGFSVWWDRDLLAGTDFATEIERQVGAARRVIVLWSTASRESKWVRDEAAYARDHDKLIPLQLDTTTPPLGFRQVHALDFHRWGGDTGAEPFVRLVASVSPGLGGGPRTPRDTSTITSSSPSRLRNTLLASAVVVLAVGALAAWLILSPEQKPGVDFEAGQVTVQTFEAPHNDEASRRLAVRQADVMERVLATNFIKIVSQSSQPEGTAPRRRAEFLIKGSANLESANVSLSLDVVHQEEGRLLWSTVVDGKEERSRQLQQTLALTVADVMRCALRLRSRADNDPSTQLFSAFLRYCEAERGDGSQWEQLPELSRRIVEAAPRYAISHATHAFSHAWIAYVNVGRRPSEELDRLRRLGNESADKAMAIDPNLGEIYWVRSLDPARSLADQERLLRRSIAVDPDFIYSRSQLANIMMTVGRIKESRSYAERVVNDYPLAVASRTRIAFLEAWFGRVPYARQLLDETEELVADHPQLVVNRYMTEFWFGDPATASELLPRLNLENEVAACQSSVIRARVAEAALDQESLIAKCKNSSLSETMAHMMLAYDGHVDPALDAFVPADTIVQQGLLFLPKLQTLRAERWFMDWAARSGLVDYWLETEKWPDFCSEDDLPYDCKEAALAVAVEG